MSVGYATERNPAFINKGIETELGSVYELLDNHAARSRMPEGFKYRFAKVGWRFDLSDPPGSHIIHGLDHQRQFQAIENRRWILTVGKRNKSW